MRVAANKYPGRLNDLIATTFDWQECERIEWVSPSETDEYAEYYDTAFLNRLGLSKLKFPLSDFWPESGPRWDALAKTESGKVILVEAKAYIEEGVDFRSNAGPKSMARISSSLAMAKAAFRAEKDASWETPFYQYANRLAHLYYLRKLNDLDAYLLYLYFADAPDVPRPCTREQWEGAIRLMERCLGLALNHPFHQFVGTLILNVSDLVPKVR
jgi:hypothetical protein